ncbi:GNAT family N-acetyltransferase (plasmid) [Polymorphobacter sp. PAMC 29334]|uniref:GNAT family N-acetyltransferase n=1 Tax=Polymorphobacter sp. PAMC 29334 TaxID=2862331 RepID=UPI001C66E013|nr:GNAT family N-acetyltransferase [Polymorphobacter sp. PAMC 29334]QYE32954.1 GNAT family N-acetyltransferase [Polymorphobacter sp. PAMC 29334]
MFEVREDDLTGEATRELLALHLRGMHANSPPGSVFALDLSGLQQPNVTVWTVWSGGEVASVGAIKMLDNGDAEVKSMRVNPAFARKGAGATILETIIRTAKSKGAKRLSLETGSGSAFDAALALYQKRGFKQSEAFSGYEQSKFNQFLHLDLLTDGN